MNKDIIKSVISSNYKYIYVIDITEDSVCKYIYRNSDFIEEEKFSFTDYVNTCREHLKEEDVDNYINSLSSNYLEDNRNKGIDYISLEYSTKEDKKYYAVIKLYEYSGKKYVLVFANEASDNFNQLDIADSNLEVSLNKLIDSVSLAIFKMYNVINGEGELNNKKDYLNTILANLTMEHPKLNKSLVDNSIYLEGGKSTILIVDDDKMTCSIIKKIFSSDYEVLVCNDGKSAIDILDSKKYNINCIFLDLLMPILDGFGVLEYLDDGNYLSKIPVIIISGNYDKQTRDRAYSYEIADMLEKPFNVQVIKHRIDNLISLYRTSNLINQMVLEQHKDLKNILDAIVKSYLYDYQGIIPKIKELVKILSTQVASDYPEYNLNENLLDKIVNSSIYFDMYKYLIPRSVLSKGSITSVDMEFLKNTFVNTIDIIKYVNLDSGVDLKYAIDIIKYRNERYDGRGYPEMLSSNAIPVWSSVVNVCAGILELWQSGKNFEQISSIIVSEANNKYDSRIVESFKKIKNNLSLIIK